MLGLLLKLHLINCMIIISYAQEANTYNAAVVEYPTSGFTNGTEDEKLTDRATKLIDLLKTITTILEIIVYPEHVLNTDVPPSLIATKIPEKFTDVICNSSDNNYKLYLKLFSCAAIKYNTSIAINVIEEEHCSTNTDCGTNTDKKYYNSLVVFDEHGLVSGRYRKWNLFGEYQLSTSDTPDIITITTKNNITFGLFICFDIIFSVPSMNLTRDLGVRNIIFPNNWISELPYLTSLQAQQMWAQENNVVLLAAGGNNPKTGASGSGIYNGEMGPINSTFIGGNGGNEVIVETISPDNALNVESLPPLNDETDSIAKDLDDFFLLRDLSMDDHSSILMNENSSIIQDTVCDNTLCCNFDISIAFNESMTGKYRYKYHLATFNGIRSFSGVRYAGIEACGVVACLNDSLSSCARRFSNYSEIYWPITFESIKVEADFIKDENRTQYPNSLTSSLRPVHPSYTHWGTVEEELLVTRRHILFSPQQRLLSFGIFGRDYGRDSSLIVKNGSIKRECEVGALVFIVALIHVLR
ncbi:unnamed protein product [Phyllotreta striolata]|uniref:CN hydrolase domain-containing protein n=1 Tax=Phyllotreta striolata TaxID=444603 RepID=A0A9N9TAA9_PHYSR|nr:unnamed protein product [Phyllotreta striolata]